MKNKPAILLMLAIFAATGCKKAAEPANSEAERSKSGELTNSQAERTIKKAFPASGNFTVSVTGIQEFPEVSMAEVHATVKDFLYGNNGQTQPPYSGNATADFQHYNTGWALTQLRIDSRNGWGGSVMFNVNQLVQ